MPGRPHVRDPAWPAVATSRFHYRPCVVPFSPSSCRLADRARRAAGPRAVLARRAVRPAIPTLKQVVGHAPGEEITSPDQVGDLSAGARPRPRPTARGSSSTRAPGRAGRCGCWSSAAPQRIGDLDQVKADLKRLADPRALAAGDADRLVGSAAGGRVAGARRARQRDQSRATPRCSRPITCWPRAATPASTRSCATSLVLIDPMQNPDGRARFLFQNLQGRAAAARSDAVQRRARRAVARRPLEPLSLRHEPRLVRADPARDPRPHPHRRSTTSRRSTSTCTSRAATTPTTSRRRPIRSTRTTPRRRSPASTSSAAPTPPASTSAAGRTSSARSTTPSIPATAISWPMFHGSIGMTYEQASARALSFARTDGTVMTYRDGVMHHFNAAITTAITAAPQPRAAAARLPRLPAQRRGRRREERRCASTCCVPGHDPTPGRQAGPQPRDAGHRGAARRGSVHSSASRSIPAGAYLVVERPARRPAGAQPARPEDRAVRRLHRPAGRAPRSGGSPIRSTTSPPGACRCSTTWRW